MPVPATDDIGFVPDAPADDLGFVPDDAIETQIGFVPDAGQLKRPAPRNLAETIRGLPAYPLEDTASAVATPGLNADVAGGEGPGVMETAMTPIVNLPPVPPGVMRVLSPGLNLLPGEMGQQIAEGAGRFASKAASALTSPGMIGLAGLGAVAPPLAAGAIAAMGAESIGPAAVEAIEASKRGDLPQFVESTLDTAMAGLMTGGGTHAIIKTLPRSAAVVADMAGGKPPVLPTVPRGTMPPLEFPKAEPAVEPIIPTNEETVPLGDAAPGANRGLEPTPPPDATGVEPQRTIVLKDKEGNAVSATMPAREAKEVSIVTADSAGNEVTLKMPAYRAKMRLTRRKNALESILDCLKGPQ